MAKEQKFTRHHFDFINPLQDNKISFVKVFADDKLIFSQNIQFLLDMHVLDRKHCGKRKNAGKILAKLAEKRFLV